MDVPSVQLRDWTRRLSAHDAKDCAREFQAELQYKKTTTAIQIYGTTDFGITDFFELRRSNVYSNQTDILQNDLLRFAKLGPQQNQSSS